MQDQLSQGSDFTVKESIAVDLIVAAVFFSMVICVLVYNADSLKFDQLILFPLVPAILFTAKAFVKTPALTINKSGIYFSKNFVTDWTCFVKGYVTQLDYEIGGYKDKVVLIIQYYKEANGGVYEQRLSLTNTQNKSEEEITKAIKDFCGLYKKN
ncbi:MAG: hypothetical protein ABJA37_06890 [Ferruginibacter sp.]